MEKMEIKVIGVTITVMILLSFAQAKSERRTDGVGCKVKCAFKCAPEQPFPPRYSKCMQDCQSHCSELSSNPVSNCISSCHLMRSIAINIGMYPHKIFTYFHDFIFLYN